MKFLLESCIIKRMNYYSIIPCVVFLLLLPFCSAEKQEEAVIEEQTLPTIVPYLDCAPSAHDGQGKVTVKPGGPFIAGSPVDFEITFTVGPAGIAPGGFVILQLPPWWGWSQPQDMNPGYNGFITVTPSFEDPSFQVKILTLHRVLVFSRQRRMKQGETIAFSYTRAVVDRFAESEERFMVFVDADGDGHSKCIAEPPTVTVSARDPVRLCVTAPSLVQPDESIQVSAAPLDPVGNWSHFPGGSFVFTVTRDGTVIQTKTINAEGKEKRLKFNYTIPGQGVYFVEVNSPSGLTGKSNVMLCQPGEPSLKLYFGDIHGHSGLSDGTGAPRDYYRYARDVSGLDIVALTDHADYGLLPIAGKVWKRIEDAANNEYVPGKFVTFAAFEWTNWTYGHRNVYYRDGSGPVFRAIDSDCDTPQKLWKKISPYEAMTIAHHVGGGPVATDWSIPPGPLEWLVEICSIHGSSDYYGCEAGIYRPKQGHFVRDALGLNYRLGIMASGDTHDGHPGQRSVGAPVTGILAVYAPGLTREAIWEAFRKRRVYGTSGPKIILNFRVCDSPMGSEVQWNRAKGAVPIAVRAVCCDEIDRIEIIRNEIPIFSEKGEGHFAVFIIEDPGPLPGVSRYNARIIQKDGGMAWSSPVWVTI